MSRMLKVCMMGSIARCNYWLKDVVKVSGVQESTISLISREMIQTIPSLLIEGEKDKKRDDNGK